MNDTPICCGKRMKVSLELGRFLEARCDKCDDTIYIKKTAGMQKPTLIDD
ncbi:MAG: hypothetical protein HY365_02420 [Candidatus Aenigmarchaeota archaeon]|nr:hypothetical protein [Candidatus Aenigmarchaeota archaeon]